MFRRDLLEVVNAGTAWAFVGSGVSSESGYPGWALVVDPSAFRCTDAERDALAADVRYKEALRRENYPRAISRVQEILGRPGLESVTKQLFSREPGLGRAVRQIVNWPFAGYVTTNYDHLLECALSEVPEQTGWVSVGNTPTEIQKVSGGVREIIWHVHGSVVEDVPSGLILTEEDYDELYLRGSPLDEALRALLHQHRIVFFGFGFRDQRMMELIKRVGSLCHPARPAFAFLSDVSGASHQAEREELLARYNVDVIPYKVIGASHQQLADLLDTYGSMVLRRDLRFGAPRRECPSYDPETTALLTHNHLVLGHGASLPSDAITSLVRAQMLSAAKYRQGLTVHDLLNQLADRIRLVGAQEVDEDRLNRLIRENLTALSKEGLINVEVLLTPDSVVRLSRKGAEFLGEQSARAELIEQKFVASLRQRADRLASNAESAARVAHAAEGFLKDCIERRALGVARAWRSSRIDFRQYHMTALLQTLPDFATELEDIEEARVLLSLIQEIFARPAESEATFIGVGLQARFGLNLLGYDEGLLRATEGQLEYTFFLIDSTTLIPYLARSSVGHDIAVQLLEKITSLKAEFGGTDLLAVEAAEHARWALDRVGAQATPASETLLEYATGRAGNRRNLFLDGYLQETALGKAQRNFGEYLDSCCGNQRGHTGADRAFRASLESKNVLCPALQDWNGFTDELLVEREDLIEEIKRRRLANETFRHDRQVKAESEAVLIIRYLREGRFRRGDQRFNDAYFVSNTGVIDDLGGAGLRVTMRPPAVIQWLGTISGCGPDELAALTNGLLWELSESGLDFVDYRRVEQVFSPLVHAAKERLQEELERHRILIAQRYGEDGERAFSEVREVDLPTVLKNYYMQKSEHLEGVVESERRAREIAEGRAVLTEKDKKALERFRRRQHEKARARLRRKRAQQSQPKGSKKNKKR